MRALFFFWLRRLTTDQNLDHFVRDSHRGSGVFSVDALLSPVESSISLRSSMSSRIPCTPA
jgi:hypothetical protein